MQILTTEMLMKYFLVPFLSIVLPIVGVLTCLKIIFILIKKAIKKKR